MLFEVAVINLVVKVIAVLPADGKERRRAVTERAGGPERIGKGTISHCQQTSEIYRNN